MEFKFIFISFSSLLWYEFFEFLSLECNYNINFFQLFNSQTCLEATKLVHDHTSLGFKHVFFETVTCSIWLCQNQPCKVKLVGLQKNALYVKFSIDSLEIKYKHSSKITLKWNVSSSLINAFKRYGTEIACTGPTINNLYIMCSPDGFTSTHRGKFQCVAAFA